MSRGVWILGPPAAQPVSSNSSSGWMQYAQGFRTILWRKLGNVDCGLLHRRDSLLDELLFLNMWEYLFAHAQGSGPARHF